MKPRRKAVLSLLLTGLAGSLLLAAGACMGQAPPASETPAPAADEPTAVPTVPAALSTTPLSQPAVAPPINRNEPATVRVDLETKEVVAQLDDGVSYEFFTFNETIPGPMVRVREGDTVEVYLKNAAESKFKHSVDLHSVTGPGGGAGITQTGPGEDSAFRFKALQSGVYVYHCATPSVPHHVANGMYGLIVVEPPEGLPPVDKEFYVMQGDIYLEGDRGPKGHRQVAIREILTELPDYVIFNGSVGSLTGDNALRASVGESVRIFFGAGGPNFPSSFHVIGEIFDRVYLEGGKNINENVQTTNVPAGGATIVEFEAEVPGRYTLVDHSLGRTGKGAAGFLQVDGPESPDIFEPIKIAPSNDNYDAH